MSAKEDVIRITMCNTYDVLMGNITTKEIGMSEDCGMVMDITDSSIRMMIHYFEGLEEYEMCAELMKKL